MIVMNKYHDFPILPIKKKKKIGPNYSLYIYIFQILNCILVFLFFFF